MTFYKLYWQSGRFSIKSKSKFVLKTLLTKILIAIIVIVLLVVALKEIYP
jgi:hypothetical protein